MKTTQKQQPQSFLEQLKESGEAQPISSDQHLENIQEINEEMQKVRAEYLRKVEEGDQEASKTLLKF